MLMTPAEIRALVLRLDAASASDEDQAWTQLRKLGETVVPYLREAYRTFRKSRGRVSLVFHAIRYARSSEDAFRLGIEALSDRATLVRYRACGEIVDNVVMLAIPGAMDAGLLESRFWGSLAVSLLIAGLVAFPVVRWLIARGRGHALVHRHHGHGESG